MAIPKQQPQFILRARVTGTITWSCPYCGHFNQSRLPPNVYRVRCTNAQCRRKFVYGVRLHEMPGGGKMTFPQDHVVPNWDNFQATKLKEPFPRAELVAERYRPGARVNEFVPSEPEPVVISSKHVTRHLTPIINAIELKDD